MSDVRTYSRAMEDFLLQMEQVQTHSRTLIDEIRAPTLDRPSSDLDATSTRTRGTDGSPTAARAPEGKDISTTPVR